MFPKMYECINADPLRPVMKYALLTKEDFVASDAHILVVHKTKEVFHEDFVKQIPKSGIFLSRECLVDIAKTSAETLNLIKGHKLIEVTHYQKSRGYFKRYHNYRVEETGKMERFVYPNYKAVFPEDKAAPIDRIKLNAGLLAKLEKAMGVDYGITLNFIASDKAIICEPAGGEYQLVKGLIMPMMITD